MLTMTGNCDQNPSRLTSYCTCTPDQVFMYRGRLQNALHMKTEGRGWSEDDDPPARHIGQVRPPDHAVIDSDFHRGRARCQLPWRSWSVFRRGPLFVERGGPTLLLERRV